MPEIDPNVAMAAAAPDEVITRVVRDIRAVTRDTDLQQMFGVVNVLLEAFFEGDLEVYRQRGDGDPSLNKVAQHPDLPFSPSTIFRFFRVTDMADRIGGLHVYPNLGLTHFREVLGLPTEQQISLLKEANAGNWSVERLAEAVSPKRGRSEADTSRHLHLESERALRELARIAEEKDGLLADMARAQFAPESQARLADLLTQLRAELQRVHDQIAEGMKSENRKRRSGS